MPPPGAEHGAVSATLAGLLWQHVRERGLGRVLAGDPGFILQRNPDSVRAPDVAFLSQSRLPAGGIPEKHWPGAPDVAAEVISPEDRPGAIDEKVSDWLAAGTRVVWLVRPRERTVTVHRQGADPVVLHESDVLDGGDVIPGFRCRVSEVFS